MRLVLVDLDGTLLKGGSEIRFIGHLIATRRIGAAALLRSISFASRHCTRFGRNVWKKNKAYLAGLPCAEIEAVARSFAEQRLGPLLRGILRERIAGHRAAGDHVLLMTGSPEFLAQPIAAALGADGCIATACARSGEVYSAAPPACHPFAGEKLALAQEAARRLELSLADCVAYADSGDDIPLLAAVGTPVAVSPDRKLARHARAQGWKILVVDGPKAPRRMLFSLRQRA